MISKNSQSNFLKKIFGVSVVTVLLCLTGCTNKNATSEHEAVTIFLCSKKNG